MATQGQVFGTTGQSIGATQLTPQYYDRVALIEARKLQYFGQLADVKSMPKNMGKTIKKYHYIPMLDDANINDQGLDATGAVIANGNLYGSSKDIGAIPAKLPVLSETGGRVNRVGFTRKELSGTLEKYGFFTEFSKDLLDFDSDSELFSHISRELTNGAMEITEDLLQLDLINNAGVVKYTGTATTTATVSHTSNLTYKDLRTLETTLDNNRCPKQTTIITGTRNIDTKTLQSCRVMYIGTELKTTIESLVDYHNERAFIPAENYAAGTTLLNGEWGAAAGFRFVVVPEMMKWAGGGATATDATYYATGGKYDVFPLLVVGEESFTTIGFQTDGKSMKFKTLTRQPGDDTADRNDPYGEMGFSSIKWWYGFMLLRGERLALIKTAAKI